MGDKEKKVQYANSIDVIPNTNDGNPTVRIRAASVIPVFEIDGEPPVLTDSLIKLPQTPASASSNTFTGPGPGPQVPILQIQRPDVVNRKHRVSGLFSKDDLSIDVSVRASEFAHKFREESGSAPGAPGAVAGRGDDTSKPIPHHPVSLGGSSIGSTSLSELYGLEGRRERYRPFRRKWRRFRRKYKGCIFAIMSSITSSLASYFVHDLSIKKFPNGKDKYSASYCLLWRYLGVLFPGILIVLFHRYFQKDKIFDTVWPLKKKEEIRRFFFSIARVVIDTLAILLNYLAFRYLLQSETSTILNSKPIIVQLLAHFTLGEEWGITPIIMSFVAGIGVIVISKPPFLVPEDNTGQNPSSNFVTDRLPGVLLATGSMLLSAVVYCILRYLKDVHYSVFSLFIGTGGVLFGLAMTFGLGEWVLPDNPNDFVQFLAVAGFVCFSSITIVIALQNEEAFVVSLVRSLDVMFSFMWEMCLSQKFPDWYNGGGALIIMFCVLVIFFRKYISHQDPTSRLVKTFYFLTK